MTLLFTPQTTSNGCMEACSATSGCSHFAWTDIDGGTCSMYGGDVDKGDAFYVADTSAVCGVIVQTE